MNDTEYFKVRIKAAIDLARREGRLQGAKAMRERSAAYLREHHGSGAVGPFESAVSILDVVRDLEQ